MPHSNGKIYTQGEYGVSTDDVASVLGVTSHDVGTLCTCSAINMWSKKKPVRVTGINPYSSSTWWKGDNGKCGILPKSWQFSSAKLQELKEASKASEYFTSDGKNGWVYQAPEEGWYFRLADFNGYLHTARPPYKSMITKAKDNWGNRYAITYEGNIHSYESQDEITIKDLFNKEYFHGVYAYQNITENGNVIIRQTDDGDNDYFHTNPNHEYKLWAFFYVSDSSERGGIPENLYTCCGIPTRTFKAEAKLTLHGYARQSGDFLYINLYVVNNSNEDITITRCYVMSKTSDNYETSKSGNEEIWLNDATITIPKNGGRATLYQPEDGYIKPKLAIGDIHLMVTIDNQQKRCRIPIQAYADNFTPEEYNNNVFEET